MDITQRAHALLSQFYGYDTFRPRQLEIIMNAMSGRDTLVLMPTGGGKSMCYQMPALLHEHGVVVVVSPLIALMNDQVAALQQIGIPADAVHSGKSDDENRLTMERMMDARIKLLYVSPERLTMEIDRWSSALPIKLFAIDEAHCISQWGHDFRPDYTRLSVIKERFQGVPVMALTATADPLTANDIVERLALNNPLRVVTSFDRPNISLEVRLDPGAAGRYRAISQMIDSHDPTDAGIVYCMSRKSTEDTCEALQKMGYRVEAYHAGMPNEERDRVQRLFISGELQAICATVAFGMGIDKSNIRWVVHCNMPANIESYYQEVGRAGRDGIEAQALMFMSMSDVVTIRRFNSESAQKHTLENKLQAMLEYSRTGICRRRVLLNYFGQPTTHNCGNCDNCLNPPVLVDGTVMVQKALSGAIRTGERVGMGMLIDILRGQRAADLVRLGFDRLKTFGVGADLSKEAWRHYLYQMVQMGIFDVAYDNFNRLRVTPYGRTLIDGRTRVDLTQYTPPKPKKKERKTKRERTATQPSDLLTRLKTLRLELARRQGVPSYIIFSDRSLEDMAEKRPRNIRDFLHVYGVGEHRAARYWEAFKPLLTGE